MSGISPLDRSQRLRRCPLRGKLWRARKPVAIGFTVLVLAFLALPVLVLVPLSFTSGQLLTLPVPGYGLRWYRVFFTDPRWGLAIRNSLVVGAATAVLATTLGTAAAWGLHRGRFPGRRLIAAALSAPIVVPSVIAGVSMYFAFAAVGLASTLAGLVLAHTVLALPYVVIVLAAALRGFDTRLLLAAESLGASRPVAFRRVVIPQIAPGIAAGALFAFAISFDELIVALFIAGPDQFTLPRQMLAGLRELLSPAICAAAVVLSGVSMLLLGVQQALRRER